MRLATLGFIASLALTSVPAAAAQKYKDYSSHGAETATLECPTDGPSAISQSLYIKRLDDKRTKGSFLAIVRAIRMDPGTHRVELLMYLMGRAEFARFNIEAKPSAQYMCKVTSNDSSNLTFSIYNTADPAEAYQPFEQEVCGAGPWCAR
jgi:hypothetical protein